MKIFLCVAITCMFVLYAVRLRRASREPDFGVRGILSAEKLNYMLSSLAFGASRTVGGNGIGLRSVRKKLFTARKNIGKKLAEGITLEMCERTLYDNFYIIEETLYSVSRMRARFRKLPHVNGFPRLYSLCELLVKSVGGVIDGKSISESIKSYCAETSLDFSELGCLSDMLGLALCEYLAIYADKIASMSDMISRGRRDAAESSVNHGLLRYNSYVYGLNTGGNGQAIAAALRLRGSTLESKLESFGLGVAEYNARISAAIKSLHSLKKLMTDKFVFSLSPVYALLDSGDKTFCKLSAGTVNMYLGEIYRAARKRGISESVLTKEILYSASRENKDVSHFILPQPRGKRAQRIYIAVYALAFVAAAVIWAFAVRNLRWLYVIAGMPVIAYSVDFFVRKAANRLVRRRDLPYYDPRCLDCENNHTAILLPCYAADGADIDDAFVHLETIIAANPEPLFSFALLFDFPESASERADGDDGLYERIKFRYAELDRDDVCVIVRTRKRIEGETKYRGYEKKRGAIHDFNRYLCCGEGEFSLKLGDVKRSTAYVITLDSDTLTNDCATLVATKSHPYTADSAIISLRCKASRKLTPYAKLYAGETGPGRYRTRESNIYADMFGLGNYTGKGIYDVRKFREALDGFFPDNRILSHDFIEGAVAGCMESSVNASEEFPETYAADFARGIRWLRGDWQLLPYILPRVRNKSGESIINPLSPIARFSIFINLVLSLVPVAQIIILYIAIFFGGGVGAILFAFFPYVLRAVFALGALRGHCKQTFLEFARCAAEAALLPTVAAYRLVAVSVTLYRLAVKRNLLQWSVSAHTKGKVTYLPNIIAAIISAAYALVFGGGAFPYTAAAVFLLGAVTAPLLDYRRVHEEKSVETLALTDDAAQRTFDYFRAQSDLYELPCDCFQADNGMGWCARTSPTNIGMALVAYASAFELGIIGESEFTDYVERTVGAVEKCEKYRGNLYNWYDCATLEVLPKRFVSTVDSGNLLTALSLVSAYMRGELKERLNKLIDETDLGAFYDNERKLLYIGYDDEIKAYTDNHYDLLGSESSLTYLAAVAYGKIPKEAYYNLDRKAVRYGRDITVYSWTGGMFEYMMTGLFMSPYSGTLLHQTMKGAVRSHIRFAKRSHSRVWGISECRYNCVDESGGNLYRAFGVPGIAYSDVPQSPPYAPYAAFLALRYCSEKEFAKNLNAFACAGAEGKYGYCEALDASSPVRSYMTHHQGMIMAACANFMKDDCIAKKLLTLPEWRAARLLCGEEQANSARRKKRYRVVGAKSEVERSDIYIGKCAQVAAIVTARKNELRFGDKCVLRDIRVETDDEESNLTEGDFCSFESAVWRKKGKEFTCETKCALIPSPRAVAVSVEYRNISESVRKIRFSTYAEPILARSADYEAHPAYSRMFIEVAKNGERYVWARRRGDGLTAAHCVVGADGVKYSGDKCSFFGRGRGAEEGQNLNPCLSSRFEVTLGAGEKCNLVCWFAISETEETAERAMRLVRSGNCLERNAGAVIRLAEAVPKGMRSVAYGLARGDYKALDYSGIPMNAPTVTREINAAELSHLGEITDGYKFLYGLGFRFNLILFCKASLSGYSSVKCDAQSVVDSSGITAAAGDCKVCVTECEDETAYARLAEHCAPAAEPEMKPFLSEDFRHVGEGKHFTVCSEPASRFCSPSIVRAAGIGGFTEDNSYYADITDADTPAPWCNIMANGSFGTVVGESGGGFTFGENSRQNKLTEWVNDPVCDDVSEFTAIGCGDKVWSVTKKPLRSRSARYGVLHARGYTVYTCENCGINTQMTVFVPCDGESKIYELKIANNTESDTELAVLCAVKPVLGDFGYATRPSLTVRSTEYGIDMSCRYSDMKGYLYCNREVKAVSAEIIGGELKICRELTPHVPYSGIVTYVGIERGKTGKICFSLSVEKPDGDLSVDECKYKTVHYYDKMNKITFDGEYGYLTEWLPYQIYNSRFAARTGYYQVSGAYGFRDQLQDCLALMYARPASVREHILECAAHQFKEGDVQHWWHPPAIGVRTHICDDRLWLVYSVCEYIDVTGDKSILEANAPYLRDVPIAPQDASVYTSARFTAAKAPLYEHCLRALTLSFDLGENGLVRMRGGDWNDAMDKAGEKGEGTSVWASMFLYAVTDKFLRYVRDLDVREKLIRASKRLNSAIKASFEGDRYLRAYCDDGRVLGSERSDSCKIDILTQSWGVLSGVAGSECALKSLATAFGRLCDEEHKIIRLLDPPFTSPEGVGYIGKYPPYVRENGGQYTQAAVWYVMALFDSGQVDTANKLLGWLSPAHRCATYEDVLDYCVEPYVSAADVYGGELAGKGGWTWYTGSGAWLYKCLIEKYAGITVRGDVMTFDPHLPRDTAQLNISVKHEGEIIRIAVLNSRSEGEWRVRIGDVIYNTPSLKLSKNLAGKKIAVIRLLK